MIDEFNALGDKIRKLKISDWVWQRQPIYVLLCIMDKILDEIYHQMRKHGDIK